MKKGNQYTNPRDYTDTEARCARCKCMKPFADFGPDSKMKVTSYCKECRRARWSEWSKKNRGTSEYKAARNNTMRKWKHKLSMVQYIEKLVDQVDGCAICGKYLGFQSDRDVHLDHDHSTGKLREFLCRNCNIGLGSFLDNPKFLDSAIAYLEKHS